MSELSVQNEVQDQDEDKCFVCFQPNNKESIPIPCLNNHPDKIHKKCLKEYLLNRSECYCGNRMHIPKYEIETIHEYWIRCCGGEKKNTKVVHGAVRFKNLTNNKKVTKEFKVTDDLIHVMPQYIDEDVSFWNQDVPYLVRIGSESNCFSFIEKGSYLCIYSVTKL